MSEGMIIGIHGLKNKPERHILEQWWKAAILEGLKRNLGEDIEPDFELVYWAELQYEKPIDLEKLDERYELAPGQGPLERANPGVWKQIRNRVQDKFGFALDKEKDLVGLGENVEKLIGIAFSDLRDYYDDNRPDKRRAMRDQLLETLTEHQARRIMLVAHSMGSIIAYDALRELPSDGPIRIEHLITMGSPLGLPAVSRNIREEFRETRTPDTVERWTNMSEPGDKICIDCKLADEYKANEAGILVEDVLVRNGYVNHENDANNHKSYGYLRTPEFSERVARFWHHR